MSVFLVRTSVSKNFREISRMGGVYTMDLAWITAIRSCLTEPYNRVVRGFPGSYPLGPEISISARHEYIYSRLEKIFPTPNIFRISRARILGKT